MTPLEHLRVWLRQREGLVPSMVVLQSGIDEVRAVVTIGDLRAIEVLASAHDGENAAKNLDDFTALSKQVETLKRELDDMTQAHRDEQRWRKVAEEKAERLAGVDKRNEQLLSELRSLNERLQLAIEQGAKSEGRAEAFLRALEMCAGLKP